MPCRPVRSFAVVIAIAASCIPWCPAFAEGHEDATLVIFRPKRFTSGAVFSAYRVNGQSLGKFKHGIFEVRVAPGRHEVRSFFPATKEEKYDELDGAITWGTYTVEVELRPGETAWVQQQSSGDLAVLARGELDDKFGQTPRRDPLVARVEGTFVTEGEALAWERCSAGNERDCRDYLERYPYGAHVAEARTTLAAVTPAPEPVTIAERTRRLPPEIQRDRHMLSLTTALKEERHADALVYFRELERLDVELSPLFWFYYGEALYETGEYDAAIDKLYAYIAEVGSEGEHYRRALELSTEAEER